MAEFTAEIWDEGLLATKSANLPKGTGGTGGSHPRPPSSQAHGGSGSSQPVQGQANGTNGGGTGNGGTGQAVVDHLGSAGGGGGGGAQSTLGGGGGVGPRRAPSSTSSHGPHPSPAGDHGNNGFSEEGMALPPRRNLWYRIFHPGSSGAPGAFTDSPTSGAPPPEGGMWGRSRRSVPSSECSSEAGDSSDDGGSGPRWPRGTPSRRSSIRSNASTASSCSSIATSAEGDEREDGDASAGEMGGELRHQPSIFDPLAAGSGGAGRRKTTTAAMGTTGHGSRAGERPSLFASMRRGTTAGKGARHESSFRPGGDTSESGVSSDAHSDHYSDVDSDASAYTSGGGGSSDTESTPSDRIFPPMKRSVSKSLFKDFLNWKSASSPNLHKLAADSAATGSSRHAGAAAVAGGGGGAPSHSMFKDLRTHHNSNPAAAAAVAEDTESTGARSGASTASTSSITSVPPAPKVRKGGSTSSDCHLSQKYGKLANILGKGSNATVRLCCPVNSTQKYAVKEFRPRRKEETQKEYVKKLVAEFCISSSLEHENVVKTVDLIQDEGKRWCVVMEFLPGGDLYARIRAGKLVDQPDEVNCYMMQLIRGVAYLHSTGVAHRDLKPENLLLDSTARHLKITDFGVSDVFRTPFESTCHKAHGLCGSGPYIAPEEFITKEYDSQLVDICYVMSSNAVPWRMANVNDPHFKQYLSQRSRSHPSDPICRSCVLDKFPPHPRAFLHHVLEPNPGDRWNMEQVLNSEWIMSLKCVCCSAKSIGKHIHQL